MIRVLAAAAATVVLAASPAASGGRSAALTIAATSVQARSSSAAIGWQASATAKVVVAYGLTDDFGVWSKPQLGRSGQALLAGLEPNTTYRYRLIAGTGSSRAESRGTFTTGPIARLDDGDDDAERALPRLAAVLPAHGVEGVRIGLRGEHRRRHQPLHGQLRERAVAARGALRQGVLRPRRPPERRRGRARARRLVPAGRGGRLRREARKPAAVEAEPPRQLHHALQPLLQRRQSAPAGESLVPEADRPRRLRRLRSLSAPGLVPHRRVPGRLPGAARARGARRREADLPVDRGGDV